MRTIISTGLLVVACSSNHPAPSGHVNSTSATASVSSMHDIVAAMNTGDAAAAADGVLAATSAGMSVVAPTTQHAPRIALPSHWPASLGEAFTGSATCSATACTFVDYGDTTSTYSYSLNGTISASNDTITFALTFDISSAGTTLHWQLDGSLTVTATLVDGSVHSHGTVSTTGTSSGDATWDVTVDYQSIGLDASGCPISGSLSASVSFTETTSSSSGSYSAAGSASFGPACGDVTVH